MNAGRLKALTPLAAIAAAAVLAACGGGTEVESTEAAPTPTAATGAAMGSSNGIEGVQSDTVRLAMAVSDLSVGTNRIAFAVINSDSQPIRDANVQVSSFFQGDSRNEWPVQEADAVFRKWPVGAGGVYTANLTFDLPGVWTLEVEVQNGATPLMGAGQLQVREAPLAPGIGSPVPRSVTMTLDDADISELTSDAEPDPALYEMTIAEALDEAIPLVVVFSTPAFCLSATCGPQLDIVKDLKAEYGDRANFVHVEVFDNLAEIQGDLRNAHVAPAMEEWNLRTDPWTFIMDADGLVQGRFEAFTTREEMEPTLAAAVQ